MAIAEKSKHERIGTLIEIKPIQQKDIETILSMEKFDWKDNPSDESQILNRMRVFPEGQMGAYLNSRPIGYLSTLMVKSSKPDASDIPNTIEELTGGMNHSTHDPSGNNLFCIRITTDPSFRGCGAARMLIDRAGKLAENLEFIRTYSRTMYKNYTNSINEIKVPQGQMSLFQQDSYLHCGIPKESWQLPLFGPEDYCRTSLDNVINFHRKLGAKLIRVMPENKDKDVFCIMQYKPKLP